MFVNTDLKYIWKNGSYEKWEDSSVHILSHTVHYGTGVFEGVRAYETEKGAAIFRLEDHTKRLFEAAKKINIEVPYSQDELNRVQKDIFIKNDLNEGYLRPIVFMGSESLGLRATDLSVNVAVAAWEWPSYMSPESKKNGISIIKSPFEQYSNPIHSGYKIIGTYINSTMALHDAISKGADEALLLDKNGYISEGSGENIFSIKENILSTPKIDHCLNGITRQSVIKIALDAMGGDGSPKKIIDGIIHNNKSNKENYFKIFGNKDEIEKLINNKIDKNFYEIVHTDNIVKSTDSPLEAAKRGKNKMAICKNSCLVMV